MDPQAVAVSGSACSTAWTAWLNTHTRQEACTSPPRLLCPDLERRGPATYARLETSNSKRQTSTTGGPDHVQSRRPATGEYSKRMPCFLLPRSRGERLCGFRLAAPDELRE